MGTRFSRGLIVSASLLLGFTVSCRDQKMADLRSLGVSDRDAEVQEKPRYATSDDSLASAKATARIGGVNLLDETAVDWRTIMASKLKTANKRDLLMNASIECGLATQTEVKGQKGNKDTSTAKATIQLRILIDGQPAEPGPITFCQRTQELTAVFGGVLESCQDRNGDGVFSSDECEFSDKELNLVLNTMNANAFNFIAPNVSSGTHTIELQAKIATDTSSQNGSAEALASIGHGAMTIESVRMIENEDVTID
jgi:hypothetical protein